ncbi:hypothetical protein HYQ46_009459 [Verticillium longisporum]|nr:hypothetical protein HYQ46_009459 [Verticillium longisporum]
MMATADPRSLPANETIVALLLDFGCNATRRGHGVDKIILAAQRCVHGSEVAGRNGLPLLVDDDGIAVGSLASKGTVGVRRRSQKLLQVIYKLVTLGHAMEGNVPLRIAVREACLAVLDTALITQVGVEPEEEVVDPAGGGRRNERNFGTLALALEEIGQGRLLACGEAGANFLLLYRSLKKGMRDKSDARSEEAEEDSDDDCLDLLSEYEGCVGPADKLLQPALLGNLIVTSVGIAVAASKVNPGGLDLNAGEAVGSVILNAHLVERQDGDEHGDLENGVDEDRTRCVGRKVADSRHTNKGAEGEGHRLGESRQQDRRTHAAERLGNPLLDHAVGVADIDTLKFVNDEEDVVDTNSKDDEWNNLGDNEA